VARTLRRLRGDGIDSLIVNVPIYQDDLSASVVHTGPATPSDALLAGVVGMAERCGMRVALRPLMQEQPFAGKARSQIVPADVRGWFASYRALVQRYARLAQRWGVEAFIVGTEFDSMQRDVAGWEAVIGDVRAVFHGRVGYSSNAGDRPYGELMDVPFWDSLDFIGADTYPLIPAADGNEESMTSWLTGWYGQLHQAAVRIGKPLVVTETGVIPRQGAYTRPSRWASSAPLDAGEQAAYYAATCQAARPVVQGIYWWAVRPDPASEPPGGFEPLGQPAEAELRACST